MKHYLGSRRSRWFAGFLAMLALLLMLAMSASAATAGWNKQGGKLYYYTKTSSGLTKATGLKKIESKYFYFNGSGQLQKGWKNTPEGFRFFRKTGTKGTIGAMYTGLKTINKRVFYFQANGVVATGLRTVSGKTYFFSTSTKLGVRGRALKNSWATSGGNRYYFNSSGVMQKSKWIGKKYYVDASGKMMKNAVTPDGQIVDGSGKKITADGWTQVNGKTYFYSKKQGKIRKSQWITVGSKKYYVDKDGVRLTQWQTINGAKYYLGTDGAMTKGLATIGQKQYYFGSDGKLVISRTVNGYTTDASGVVISHTDKTAQTDETKKTGGRPKVLIIAGHGQGDVGATSLGNSQGTMEYLKTREFAKLIYQQLKKYSGLDVEFYKNGSKSYDCYQQHRSTFSYSVPSGSSKTFSSLMTGKGIWYAKNAALVRAQYAKNGNLPKMYEYDYVLEIHFNAKAYKETQKDGRFYGSSIYINSYKKDTTIDRAIIQAMTKGFAVFGGGSGITRSTDLLNAKLLTEMKVNYSLLETAFIDDMDDMAYYEKHKSTMAKNVAAAIAAFLGA